MKVTSGPDNGRQVVTDVANGPGAFTVRPGNAVTLMYLPDDSSGAAYQIQGHQRGMQLWLLAAIFAVTVIAFGRLRGITALARLVVTFAVLLLFIVPALLYGEQPLLVAIFGSTAIMLTVLYLTHGLNLTTTVAVLGTLASLVLTGLLSWVGTAFWTTSPSPGSVTVSELARANPAYTVRQLYQAATRVGRSHIASVVNTIILAYAGASQPLLVLLAAGTRPLGQTLTHPLVAQEIVRAVVGRVGLIAAVPITTLLAATAARRMPVARTAATADTEAEPTDRRPHDPTPITPMPFPPRGPRPREPRAAALAREDGDLW